MKDTVQHDTIAAMVASFKQAVDSDREVVALDILQRIFSNFSFDLKAFCLKHSLKDQDRSRFLSYLLYGIYFNEIYLPNLLQFFDLESLFIVLAAETVEEKTIQKILRSLSSEERLSLMAHCMLHPREGAWCVMNLFEILVKNDAQWVDFLQLLKSHYYSAKELKRLIQSSFSFDSIVEELKKHTLNQLTLIQQVLPTLIDLIITAPRRGSDLIAQMKHQLSDTQKKDTQMDAGTLQAEKKMQSMFLQYKDRAYTISELEAFFKIFGLEGYYPYAPSIPLTMAPLADTLKTLRDLFKEPIYIPIDYLNSCILFVERICQQLHAFIKEPSQYAIGLQRLVYTMATRASNLSTLSWLPSVLAGLQKVNSHLKDPVNSPVIIFDQSTPKDLARNRAYTRHLTQFYHQPIWHLSTSQTLTLARKWGLKQWFGEAKKGMLGYATSRNCLFFLAPVIHRAAQNGVSSYKELLALPKNIVQAIYNSAVMGQDGQDAIIHTGEDDVAIPACNFFADALYAAMNQKRYFQRASYCIGRSTLLINPLVDIETIAKLPSYLYSSTSWQDEPKLGAMRGKLTKPRFCFAIPFGNEENHVSTLATSIEFFQQPLLHLGGTRFPKKLIPENPLDGILEYLKKYLPYTIQIALSSFVLDSSHKHNRCMLPWNDLEFKAQKHVQCFQELWEYVAKQETLDELKSRFWRNFEAVFRENNENIFLIALLDSLIHPNLTLPVPIELKVYYSAIQRDAKLFLQLGKLILHVYQKGSKHVEKAAKDELEKANKINITDYPLTYSLFQFVKYMINFPILPHL